ncbi:hypothetical protein ES703_114695 [subsurface metagenome]
MNLIERNADKLSENLTRDLRQHATTPTYHTYDEKELYERAFNVYSNLGKWISRETTKEDIARYYMTLGAQRKKEGFALSEVIQALTIARRHIWLKVQSEGFLDTILDLNQAIELSNRVVLFFDRAIYYTAFGYEQRS